MGVGNQSEELMWKLRIGNETMLSVIKFSVPLNALLTPALITDFSF